MSEVSRTWDALYKDIRAALDKARSESFRAVNFAMVQAYWNIGRIIVEEEQKGKKRADYGKALIAEISERLTNDYGKGFTPANVWYMRQFFVSFPILHALRGELTWTHFKKLNALRSELTWTNCRRPSSPRNATNNRIGAGVIPSTGVESKGVGIPSWEGSGVGTA